MLPNELDSIEKTESLLKEEKAVLLYFYSDNCAPCQSLRPKVVELVCDHFSNIKVTFINGEKHPDIPAHYNSFSFPTIILYFEGKEYTRKSKYVAIPELSNIISRPYKMLFEN